MLLWVWVYGAQALFLWVVMVRSTVCACAMQQWLWSAGAARERHMAVPLWSRICPSRGQEAETEQGTPKRNAGWQAQWFSSARSKRLGVPPGSPSHLDAVPHAPQPHRLPRHAKCRQRGQRSASGGGDWSLMAQLFNEIPGRGASYGWRRHARRAFDQYLHA